MAMVMDSTKRSKYWSLQQLILNRLCLTFQFIFSQTFRSNCWVIAHSNRRQSQFILAVSITKAFVEIIWQYMRSWMVGSMGIRSVAARMLCSHCRLCLQTDEFNLFVVSSPNVAHITKSQRIPSWTERALGLHDKHID